MSHDKIKAAARRRMAQTGEPYATARRKVIREHQASGSKASGMKASGSQASGSQAPGVAGSRFQISYDQTRLDNVLGIGPESTVVEVDAEVIRVRMGWAFRLDIPRASVASVARSDAHVGGTRGVHGRAGRWLVNGSAHGMVEIAIEPPCYLQRGLSTLFRRARVSSLRLSLADPAGFIAAAGPDTGGRDGRPRFG